MNEHGTFHVGVLATVDKDYEVSTAQRARIMQRVDDNHAIQEALTELRYQLGKIVRHELGPVEWDIVNQFKSL
jgi:hypothetical protein